jgi:hypothetical protein
VRLVSVQAVNKILERCADIFGEVLGYVRDPAPLALVNGSAIFAVGGEHLRSPFLGHIQVVAHVSPPAAILPTPRIVDIN